jgi:hypothetical protein
MKTLQLAVAALVLAAAAPALALGQSTPMTTGAWSPTKPSATVAVTPSDTRPTAITTGAWAPTKPTVRATSPDSTPTVIGAGPVAPTRPSGVLVAGR